jgi:hypothetical protein
MKRYELSETAVKKFSEMRMQQILENSNGPSNLRESILYSELEDFKKLKNIKFLDDLATIVIERYKLEKIHSFNMDIDKKFSNVLNSINELSDFSQSQQTFYNERITVIQNELKDL